MNFPCASWDDLCEMLLEAEANLDRLDCARSVSPEAEVRRLESRARCVRWIGLVRDDLNVLERMVAV